VPVWQGSAHVLSLMTTTQEHQGLGGLSIDKSQTPHAEIEDRHFI